MGVLRVVRPTISLFILASLLAVFSWNCGRGSRPNSTQSAGLGFSGERFGLKRFDLSRSLPCFLVWLLFSCLSFFLFICVYLRSLGGFSVVTLRWRQRTLIF